MNETTNATPTTPAPKAKRAAKKAKPAPEVKLPKPCRQVLRTLAKCKGGLSRKIVAERVAKAGDGGVNKANGRINDESNTYASLLKSKLIQEHELGNGSDIPSETVYSITAAGRKAYDACK